MRILSFLIVNLLLTGTAVAQSRFDGFYIGAEALFSDHSVSLLEGDVIDSEDVGLRGFGGNGVLGWGTSGWDGVLYGSVEFGAGYDGASSLQEEGKITAREFYALGYRVGGIWAERVLFYGRMDWQRTTFEYLQKESFNGFRVGGGIEAMPFEHFGIRAEYTFTTYSDGVKGVDIDMQQHLARVGLMYHF